MTEKVGLSTRLKEPSHDRGMTLAIGSVHVIKLPAELHPETRRMVCAFAEAMAAKLRQAEIRYGYEDHWRTDEWEHQCRKDLINHLNKGDPLDVAIYAAFMHARGWRTVTPEAVDRPPASASRPDAKWWLPDFAEDEIARASPDAFIGEPDETGAYEVCGKTVRVGDMVAFNRYEVRNFVFVTVWPGGSFKVVGAVDREASWFQERGEYENSAGSLHEWVDCQLGFTVTDEPVGTEVECVYVSPPIGYRLDVMNGRPTFVPAPEAPAPT